MYVCMYVAYVCMYACLYVSITICLHVLLLRLFIIIITPVNQYPIARYYYILDIAADIFTF